MGNDAAAERGQRRRQGSRGGMVTEMTRDVVSYPFAHDDALDMDAAYRDLQRRGPIRVQLPFGEPCWLATRYHDVKAVYGDRRFGRAIGVTHDPPALHGDMKRAQDPALLLNMDPPQQTRMRRLTSGAFSPQKVRSLRDRVQHLADELTDDMVAAGPPVDFAALFSKRLPVLVIASILGVAGEDIDSFREWADTAVALDASPEARGEAQGDLVGYIVQLIAQRRERRTDDLLSDLVEARDEEDRLSEAELIQLCMSIWLGGFETTVSQLATTAFTLLSERERWQELVEDRELLPAALEDLWRWIPGMKYGHPFVRWAGEDLELSGGTLIRAGEAVLPEHTVANRDESVYPGGWELDFHRENPMPHLTFGWGPHHCMGAHLAHLEVDVALQALLGRFPGLALAVPAAQVKWSPSTFMRSVVELPVTW